MFISYKMEDRARLIPLVAALEAEGFTIWWDTHIGAGASWRRDIEQHLEAAKCVIVAWTKRTVGPEGEFVRDEAAWAKRHGTYLPVCLDAVEQPLGFGEVQTISLKGWHGDRKDPRFQTLAHAVRERITGEHVSEAHGHFEQARVSRRAVVASGAGLSVVVAAGGAWLLLKPSSAAASDSIAVLPFANLSGDPSQAYFSDGLAEELRSALARIPQLKVVARTSSEAVRNDDVKTAAHKLDVDNILTGSVRRSPSMIRISAQLVDGRTGLERWSKDFDRPLGDTLAIQTNIAENVADAMRIQLVGAAKTALTLGGTGIAAAQDLYLQGDVARNDSADGLKRAIARLDQAIRLDPNYAQAYARKANALAFYGAIYASRSAEVAAMLSAAATTAKRAIALAPNLPVAHFALAFTYRMQLRLKDSWSEIQRAVNLPGADQLTFGEYAIFLTMLQRGDEALKAGKRSILLDPLNPAVFRDQALVHFQLHQFAPAIAVARYGLELGPSQTYVHALVGYSLVMMRRYGEAAAEFSKLPAGDVHALMARAVIAERTGDTESSNQLLQQLRTKFGAAASFQYAQIYAQREDPDAAIAALNEGLVAHDPGLVFIRTDPFLDPIRSDRRLTALIGELDFPA